jgi:transketolase
VPFDVQAALVALRFDSEDPIWPNRDRFVLSNGHASMLLYAIHHLSGVGDLSSVRVNIVDV